MIFNNQHTTKIGQQGFTSSTTYKCSSFMY